MRGMLVLVFLVAPFFASAEGESKAMRQEIGNRIIDISTRFSKEITHNKVKGCYGASPIAVMATIDGFVRSLIPDDVERSLKLRTSFFDVLDGNHGMVVGRYEVLGHLKPIDYEVRFAATGNPEGSAFDMVSISSTLYNDSKTQTERMKGVCEAWKIASQAK